MASTTTNNESPALASLAAAQESLRQTSSSDFNELRSYGKPPLACVAILEGIGILINPTQEKWEWTDDKKLMAAGRHQFLENLFQVDKNNISEKQLEKLKSILARDDCQPNDLANVSSLISKLGVWLRALVDYTTQRQGAH